MHAFPYSSLDTHFNKDDKDNDDDDDNDNNNNYYYFSFPRHAGVCGV
jgi:hypothetical protein